MCNEGKVDRIFRILVGIGLLIWGYLAHSWWGAIGLIPLLTGLFGFCPLYAIFRINTGCRTKHPEE
jgi:hypothetical protein